MSIFLNGVRLNTTALYASNSVHMNTSISSTNSIALGGSDGQRVLNGKIYNFRVYSNALLDETISRYAASDVKDYNYQTFFSQQFPNLWPAQP